MPGTWSRSPTGSPSTGPDRPGECTLLLGLCDRSGAALRADSRPGWQPGHPAEEEVAAPPAVAPAS
eukprot:6423459-Pyramimonas_sp.AAC.1